MKNGKKTYRIIQFISMFLFFIGSLLVAVPNNFQLDSPENGLILSNAIGDIDYYDGRLFIATVDGMNYSDDMAGTFGEALVGKGFSALKAGYGKVFLTSSRDTVLDNTSFPLGGGLYFRDIGTEEWTHIEAPEFTFKPDIINPGNLAYDIEVVPLGIDTAIWIPCFYGGLVKSVDWGENWAQIVPDGYSFDPTNRIAHRHFSFAVDTFGVQTNEIYRINDIQQYDNPVYVSTEWGLFKSYDYGVEFFPEVENHSFGKIYPSINFMAVGAYRDTIIDSEVHKLGEGIYVYDRSPEIWTMFEDSLFVYDPEIGNYGYFAHDFFIEADGSDTTFWIAAGNGGLVRSYDFETFERVGSDFVPNDPAYIYKTIYIDTTTNPNGYWAGTEDGLLYSNNPDSGWARYAEEDGLAGNHIIQIEKHKEDNSIWVTTKNDNALNISYDNGSNWEIVYDSDEVYDIDFGNSIVHIATESGLYHSEIETIDWQDNSIVGSYTELTPKSPDVYSVKSIDDTLIVAIDRGIAYSMNFYTSPIPAFFVNTTPVDYYWDFPIIWDGSGGGISMSEDGGKTWENFTATDDSVSISGNWVVAIEVQRLDTTSIVWAVTKKALGTAEYNAISYTTDNGQSWEVTADGAYGWNFAFCDSIVFCATSAGLLRAKYPELEWDTLTIYDPIDMVEVTNDEIVGLHYAHGHLFVGTNQGLAISDNICNLGDDYTFHLISKFPSLPSEGEDSYAYPSPFSPYSDGACFIVFPMQEAGNVDIKVYDWVLDEVAIIENGTYYSAGTQRAQWYGKNRNGKDAANGVYFIKVETPSDSYWTKVMLVK
ncbi:MAG: hypothetical protein ACLFSQ_05805 [Candidatus Zixiibacteriota bacterium]